jgi:aminomethyltransferase
MFSTFDTFSFKSKPIFISRCGYTGEDGFEVSVPNDRIIEFMETLLEQVDPATNEHFGMLVGLAARDSLRLEAGLCLYGHDLNESVSPIEAQLAWTISKRRREEGGFLGYEKVKDHLVNGVTKKRVGFEI